MFHVYILQNPVGRFYIGHTDNLKRRLRQHNEPEGKSHLGKFTHKNGPWTLVWSEPHFDRSSAMRREQEIKRWKSARLIQERLLSSSVVKSRPRRD